MSVITSHQLKKASGRMPNAKKPKTGKDLRTPPTPTGTAKWNGGASRAPPGAAQSAISGLHMGRFFKKIKRVQYRTLAVTRRIEFQRRGASMR
jgi:hypothetical protein